MENRERGWRTEKEDGEQRKRRESRGREEGGRGNGRMKEPEEENKGTRREDLERKTHTNEM